MSSLREKAQPSAIPFWSYGDLGMFFMGLVVLILGLHLLARFHLLAEAQLFHPSDRLQIAIVLYLTVVLYAVLKLRYRQRVLAPLGWVRPTMLLSAISVSIGVVLGIVVAFYQHSRSPATVTTPSLPLVLVAVLLAPILEESLFRGCLFPLLSTKAGSAVAVAVTAGEFALFHGPTDLAHWILFGCSGIGYGLIRAASGTTTGPAMAHSAYNLVLLLTALRGR